MSSIKRVVLVDIIGPHEHQNEASKKLNELKSLVSTYEGITVVEIIQHRKRPDKATFIGSGKMEELAAIVKDKQIDIVVINAVVKVSVLFNILQILWGTNRQIQVWDRIDLILNIFDKHAATREAKLQIEIAKMKHMGPRVYGLGQGFFSRQAGGIGTRGIGEKNLELMKRHWRNQIKIKQDELSKLTRERLRQLERRQENNLPTIALVGYTNAGKTTLFNRLTGKSKLAKNVLFATLDSVSGRVHFPSVNRTALVSDTIGFIQELPSSLIDSFKSTLLESVHADILLHVIDISDPEMEQKIAVVEQILRELQVKAKHIVYVFNKIDAYIGDAQKQLNFVLNNYSHHQPQFISVTTDFGIEKLKENLGQLLDLP